MPTISASRRPSRGEDELLDQLVGLVAGGIAVVARLHHRHVGRDQLPLELLDTGDHRVGDRRGVLAGFLRHRDGHCRQLRAGPAGRSRAVPYVLRRQVGAVGHPGHVGQVHRPPAASSVRPYADDQLRHLAGTGEELPGPDLDVLVARGEVAGRRRGVGRRQGPLDVGQRDAVGVHPLRLDGHPQHAVRPAERDDFARARDALQLDLQRVGDLGQRQAAGLRPLAVQGQGDDRHVVDALGLDDGLAHADVRLDPVAVGHQRVVQSHQRRDAVLADLELHRQDGQPGPRDREDVLDAGDLRDHLLGRHGDDVVHVLDPGAGERDQHVGHRHVDLRLLLLRRDQHREDAEQQADQRDQRRDLRGQEGARDAARDAERGGRIRRGAGAHGVRRCFRSPRDRPAGRARRARRRKGRPALRPCRRRRGCRPAPGAAAGRRRR